MSTIKEKTKVNKLKRLKQHVKKHPQDSKNLEYYEGLLSGKITPNVRKKSEAPLGWINSTLKNYKGSDLEELKKYFSLENRRYNLKYLGQLLKLSQKFKNEELYTKTTDKPKKV